VKLRVADKMIFAEQLLLMFHCDMINAMLQDSVAKDARSDFAVGVLLRIILNSCSLFKK